MWKTDDDATQTTPRARANFEKVRGATSAKVCRITYLYRERNKKIIRKKKRKVCAPATTEMSILLSCCGAVTSRAVDRTNARGSFFGFLLLLAFCYWVNLRIRFRCFWFVSAANCACNTLDLIGNNWVTFFVCLSYRNKHCSAIVLLCTTRERMGLSSDTTRFLILLEEELLRKFKESPLSFRAIILSFMG